MPVREVAGVRGHEPGPAGQRAPDPEGGRERVASLDGAVAGAEQPEPRPLAGGQHEVARQRRAVPAEERDGVPLAQPRLSPAMRPRTPSDVVTAAASMAASCSTSLMTRSPSAGSMSRSVAFSTPPAARPARAAHRPGSSARRGSPGRRTSSSPRPRPGALDDALVAEDLRQGPGAVARLGGQAEVLVQLDAHRQRRRAGHPEHSLPTRTPDPRPARR